MRLTAAATLVLEAPPRFTLGMSSAAYLGAGHRIEFSGEDGTLVLVNSTADYMRGFELHFARRPAQALECIAIEPPDTQPDGRIGPVSRLAARFLDAIDTGKPAKPDIRDGYRVQQLIDAARLSHKSGERVEVAPAWKAEAVA